MFQDLRSNLHKHELATKKPFTKTANMLLKTEAVYNIWTGVLRLDDRQH
jgi:hypothetical protein